MKHLASVVACSLLLVAFQSPPGAGPTGLVGLVVESVDAGGGAAGAGLEPGDLLMSWRSGDVGSTRKGELRLAFDLELVEVEEAARKLTLFYRRGDMASQVEMPAQSWALRVRPPLTDQEHARLEAAERLVESGELDQAAASFRDGAEAARQAKRLSIAMWWTGRIASLYEDDKQWARARAVLGETRAVAEALDSAGTVAYLHGRIARTYQEDNEPDHAADSYQAALELQTREEGPNLSAALTLQHLGTVALESGELDEAQRLFERSLEMRERVAPGSLPHARALVALGRVTVRRGEFDRAARFFEDALQIQEALDTGSLDTATLLNNLGVVAGSRGDLTRAGDYFNRALAIRERLAPDTRVLASTLTNLGNVAYGRGNLEEAESYFERALSIEEAMSLESLRVASILSSLGNLLWTRGDLSAAEIVFRQTLSIRQALAPGSLQTAEALDNLGRISADRGHLTEAERFYRRAIELTETIAPESLMLATTLGHFAAVADLRNDLDLAESYHRRALSIVEGVAPDTLYQADILDGLGRIARKRDDLEDAEALHRTALVIRERLAPRSFRVAESLNVLGAVALERRDFETAEAFFQRSLALSGELAPESLPRAEALDGLGRVAFARGQIDEAEQRFTAALAIRRQLAPASALEAGSLYRLAVHNRERDPETSRALFEQCLDALESQRGRLGGSATGRAGWGAGLGAYYRDYMNLLVDLGMVRDAFLVLERFRARGLVELIAEGDLVLSSDVSPELERERRLANTAYDKRLGELLAPDGKQGQSRTKDELVEELRRARLRQEDVEAQIRSASPRLASLEYPRAVGASDVLAMLEPGELVLSFSIAAKSYLFVMGPDERELAMFSLDVDVRQLRDDVARFRALIRDRADRNLLRTLSRRLSAQLLGPAAERLSLADRVILVPDGPLHYLPVGALMAPGGEGLVVERWASSVVSSVSVLAELRKTRRPGSAAAEVVAFGDPKYPRSEPGATDADALLRQGFDPVPLPATRQEVDALERIFPDRVRAYVGGEATEERAKAMPADTAIAHFACHAVLDESSPLESALVLSVPEESEPGRDNGLLQAWEILETVRIDADLVTLSACDTALGAVYDGEGMLGLTRAFQYAGARSVLASLWGVGDQSTAGLMAEFYRHVARGTRKDEALRLAQSSLLNGDAEVEGGYQHPFYWAAFVLNGDAR